MTRDELIALAKLVIGGELPPQAQRTELARAFLEADAERERLRDSLRPLCEHDFHKIIHETEICEEEKTTLRAERAAARAEVELLREELRNRTADLDDARRELDALGVPSNGDEGYGKRFTLSTDQRIAHLGAELSALRAAILPIGEFLKSRGDLSNTGDWRVPLTGDELEAIRKVLKS